LNGSCATTFYFGAYIHALSGDAAIAEDFAGKALRLSPLDPFSFFALYPTGIARFRERRFDEAPAYYSKAVQANPRFSPLYMFHTSALAQAGPEEEARSVAGRLLALEPNFRVQPFMAAFSPFLLRTLLICSRPDCVRPACPNRRRRVGRRAFRGAALEAVVSFGETT